ncbi:putative secreted protein (Por secretion system target) [Gelidibacter sediminis]|uniref:Putative secreted protein (Por secretion system target) n=1 Tax=Gelidibacter sediminis TaxID=1608710 RepID=A0A4R7Q8G3_9FLAO|nr:zinc-dependent metalloprotease family protein [Gelidibacter sediminis]TDU43282.1 putative secreted protein (Por secretion system target) [Gelidibacter sediminis]
MDIKYLKASVFSIVIFAFSMGYAQKNESAWTKILKEDISLNKMLPQQSIPEKATYYNLNMDVLKRRITTAPQRDSGVSSKTLLDFPDVDGNLETFKIMEYSVMHPDLQSKFPEIRSYMGNSLNNPATVVYFSVSPQGLHAMTLAPNEAAHFINPYTKDGAYEVFSRNAIPIKERVFECGVIDDGLVNQVEMARPMEALKNANDGMRRTFRLAIGTSIEYTNFHGGTVASALSAINTTMTRVNGIYDRELSLRMSLVANNNLLISTTNNSIFSNTGNIGEITNIINTKIGVNAYDIGHTFTTGSGGSAYLARVCTNSKGGGTTGLSQPIGDPYNIDYVAHEMGHQFGATHTFNSGVGNCLQNRSEISAYEPGSGSTIMAYAGLCAPQNVQRASSDYFHQISLQQIWTNITQGNSTCAILTATGNTAPKAMAGPSYNIPISTPFKLTGSSTDADGKSTHTYTWEQFDLGEAGPATETTRYGPIIRSLNPSASPVRYIPRYEDVLFNGGISTTWEKLPSIERTLTFAFTVRDNDTRGGQTAVDVMEVHTIDAPGPFKVTSQNENITWEIGATKKVTWDVANTNRAPINTPTVNIKLSIDGGVTFPYILAANVPNDGAHDIKVPNGTETSKARILVEGVGNIFYNVNTTNFKIITVDYLLNFTTTSIAICQPESAVYNFTYNTYGGYAQNTVFSVKNLPSGATATFNPTSASVNGTAVTMTISETGAIAPGNYPITAVGTSGSLTQSSIVELAVFNSVIKPVTLTSPSNGASGLYGEIDFSWNADVNIESYLLEISTTANFDAIVESQILNTNTYTTNLADETVYYWRVTGVNRCSGSKTSPVYSFSTGISTCGDPITATDTPIIILPDAAATYTSIINVQENLPVTDVEVKVNIQHDWVRDLKLVLVSPEGTSIILTNNNGLPEAKNYTNTVFDQQATDSITNGTAPFTGSYIPEENLSQLNGEMSGGQWKLNVIDLFDTDGGQFIEFTLQLCLSRPLAIEDKEFVGFGLFPNPSKGEFTVKLQSSSGEAVEIDVYDIRGRKVFEKRYFNTTNFRETIRLDNAQSGMYLMTITDGLRKATKKILVN